MELKYCVFVCPLAIGLLFIQCQLVFLLTGSGALHAHIYRTFIWTQTFLSFMLL